MQHTDTDIDLALDDEAELDVANAWGQLFKRAGFAYFPVTVIAVLADLTGRDTIVNACMAAAVLLTAVAVFALVMEYRADHRAATSGGHNA